MPDIEVLHITGNYGNGLSIPYEPPAKLDELRKVLDEFDAFERADFERKGRARAGMNASPLGADAKAKSASPNSRSARSRESH